MYHLQEIKKMKNYKGPKHGQLEDDGAYAEDDKD